MRALFIIHELALNGAVVALLEQARRMVANGHRVTVLTPPLEGGNAALLHRFHEAGVQVVNTAVAADHDIAVGCTVFAADALHDLLEHLPIVWWVHEGRAGAHYILTHPKAARVMERAGKVIFPSRSVAERVCAIVLGSQTPVHVDVVPGLVPAPPSVASAAKPPGHLRVLCVGTVYPRKRQTDLVQAVAMLRGRPIECVLVGEVVHPLGGPGEQIARASPERFKLTGGLQQGAVCAYYRSADVFSLPSSDESMPLAPIEAAWHDVPVVLSDLECYAGIWRHGVNALIHPVGDVEMLAWYLRILIESQGIRERLVAAGRAVAARFGESRAGALFDAALEETITAWAARMRPTQG